MSNPNDGAVPFDDTPIDFVPAPNIITAAEFEALVPDFLGRERTPAEIAESPVQTILEEPSK
jgi:hypothetical protein